jgi:DNA-binding LacI/PurR family transcriptional regulator
VATNARLRDVAARAGVSVRTVSNVVNGFAHVSPGTRRRVQQAIEELDYRPNLAARQLRRGRSDVISLVVPELDSPYFSELASIVVRAAEKRGLLVHIDQTDGDPVRERRMLDGPVRGQVDGVIFSPWAMTPGEVSRRAVDVPLVMLGERSGMGQFDRVAVDNVAAARDATAHLLRQGRRHVAAIGLQPHLSNETARLRRFGYQQALRDAGVGWDDRMEVRVRRLHRADGAEALTELLGRPVECDALFCFTDQLALGAMRALAERGVHVPDDVAVVGFDDIEDGRYSVPSLTTVSPDKQQIADVALDCLLGRLADPERAVEDVVAPHRLAVRESSTHRGRVTGPGARASGGAGNGQDA